MVKEACFRCKRPVYPTDKIGPLKDGAFFHHGCFKCYICGTRLALKTYCNNRNDIEDREVYCSSHVPLPNPHEPAPHRPANGNGLISPKISPDRPGSHNSPNGDHPHGGIDMKMQHALKATELQKPYPKITHPGAKYQLDYDVQTRLELLQRQEEDEMYKKFSQAREEEERRLAAEAKEEWERALVELSKRYDKQMDQHKGVKARDDLIKHLTLKRDKQRETLHMQLRERERAMTAELVEKQSKEMMDLYRQARQMPSIKDQQIFIQTPGPNGHLSSPHNGHHNGIGAVPNGFTNGHHTNGSHPRPNGSIETSDSFHSGQQNGRTSHQLVTAMMNGLSVGNGYHHTNGGGAQMDRGDEYVNGVSPSFMASYPSTPPPPFPPAARKRDTYTDVSVFDSVDQTAISVAQSEQQTFTDLVRALTEKCKSDIEKARAIYRWITIKNLNLMEFDSRIDPNTPMGILRGIKFGTESYHVLFKRLCSYAGLHCVVIKGYSKSAGYQPGMRFEDSRFRNTWNAVFLDGSWRFVQCNWGARHLVNAKDAPSANGGGPNSRFPGRAENLRYEYDDHYFMTDPEEFIFEFFPHQPEWQLLKRPISLREFEDQPFVRSLFFRYGLSFADPQLRAAVEADKTGAATVAINMSPEAISSLIFHYNLRYYHNDEQDHNGVSLKRFVMQSVVGHSVVFRVHTPCRGDFLLDVFANAITPGEYLTGQPMKFKSVCKFKIVCEHLNVIMVPLPECASGEWGPAKAYRLFGLIPLTHEDAIVNSGRELEVRFRMTRPLVEFVASLHKNLTDDRKLQRAVSHVIKGDQVVFRVLFPDDGQYGLDIYTRDKAPVAMASNGNSSNGHHVTEKPDKQLLTHCCKFLINARSS